MARFTAYDSNGQFNGLNELATITTDASGRFSYTFTELYNLAPNVQCQPISNATGVLNAAASMSVTIQAPTQNASTGVWSVSGIVTGVTAVTVASVSVLGTSLLMSPVQLQLMVLGR